MDKPTSRVQQGVFTTPVWLDSDLVPDDAYRFPQHRVRAPRRVGHPGRALTHVFLAIAAAISKARPRRIRRPIAPVVTIKDRAPL